MPGIVLAQALCRGARIEIYLPECDIGICITHIGIQQQKTGLVHCHYAILWKLFHQSIKVKKKQNQLVARPKATVVLHGLPTLAVLWIVAALEGWSPR